MTRPADPADPVYAAETVRAALEDLARDARGRLAASASDVAEMIEASRDSNADDEHDPDGATIAFERAQAAALARTAQDRLDEVAAALERLDDGSYGVCERCGRAIPAARLEARPTARTCVACATGIPRSGSRAG